MSRKGKGRQKNLNVFGQVHKGTFPGAPFEDTALENNACYADFFYRMYNLAMNVFRWENLPDTVSARFLEQTLFWWGYALYFRDEVAGDVVTKCTLGGKYDIYGVPMERNPYTISGVHFGMKDKLNSVLIPNNYQYRSTAGTVQLYAKRLYNIQRAIDVNVRQQKTPKIVLANEQQRLTMLNLFEQYDGNVPFIFGDSMMDLDSIKSIDTSSSYLVDKLELEKHTVWNEFLSFIGVENSNQDKKERLVSAEVGSNYGYIEAERNVMLNAREIACEEINKMFGVNVSIKFNSELATMLNTPYADIAPQIKEKEVKTDE